MIIHTNFVKPIFPELYEDAIDSFKNDVDKSSARTYGTALGNKSYRMKRLGLLIFVTEVVRDESQPIGYK